MPLLALLAAGKSTLANLIPRLLNVQTGELFLDGYDVTKIFLKDLRRAIAYVPQDSFLFSTTIKNNIRYGEPLSETPEIEYAAKQAQIQPEIINFPQKYETVIGERGITLSGGQRQRTSLARALLIDAPVLILDDALSSVDNQTATQILSNLSDERQKKNSYLYLSSIIGCLDSRSHCGYRPRKNSPKWYSPRTVIISLDYIKICGYSIN